MKALRTLYILAAVVAAAMCSSCDNTKTYAELLTEEDKYVNTFLSDQRVEMDIPADTVFEVGPNAPYYRLDEDGFLYMQVLKAGTPGNRVENDQQIFFRFTRYALADYANSGKLPVGAGNNITLKACWFRYQNFSIQNSYDWGVGIQRPLEFLPIDCEVNLVVKSQYGIMTETTNVQPYLWTLTYESRQ